MTETLCGSEGMRNSCQMTGTSGYGMTALPQQRVVSDDTRCLLWTRCQTRAKV